MQPPNGDRSTGQVSARGGGFRAREGTQPMSTLWRTTEFGTFQVADRQGLLTGIFGGLVLVVPGCFLYWLRAAVLEAVRFGTWRDARGSEPGAVFGYGKFCRAMLSIME